MPYRPRCAQGSLSVHNEIDGGPRSRAPAVRNLFNRRERMRL